MKGLNRGRHHAMRILFLSHFIPHPPTGGASLRNFNLIKQLACGNELHLLTFTQTNRHPTTEHIERSRQALASYCRQIEIVDVPSDRSRLRWCALLALNAFAPQPYSAWRFRSRRMLEAIDWHLDRFRYDLVHVDTIALAGYLPHLRGLPAVLNHHNVESALLLRRAATERNPAVRAYIALQGWKLRRAETRALTAFDGNIAVSALDKAELSARAPTANITVIPNGTDTRFFRPQPADESGPSLVFAGTMAWYPNADAMEFFARKIWPLIKRRVPGVTMNLIGASPPAEVRRLGERDPSFRVLGFVDDVRPYIAQAAVYVVPIRVGGGTRLKILDAMAMGKAIVSHPIGAEGLDLAQDKEILIAAEPERFAQQVVALLHDRSRRQQLARAARARAVASYAWDRIAPRLERCYRDVTAARHGTGRQSAATAHAGPPNEHA